MKKTIAAILLSGMLAASGAAQAETFWGCEYKSKLGNYASAIVVNEKGAFYSKGKGKKTMSAGVLEVKDHNDTISYSIGAMIDGNKYTDYVQWRIFFGGNWRVLEAHFKFNKDGAPVLQTANYSDADCRQIFVEDEK